MLSFILQILIMLSLGTMLYVIAKTLPRIDDTAPKELVFTEHWVLRKIERVDKKIKTSSEKFLRRLGVFLLKWENKVNKKVTRLREESAKETTKEVRGVPAFEKEGTPETLEPPKRRRKNREEKSQTSEDKGLYS
ncbi:MAG: hypothetical protein AAB634_00775 [Patescibacteria group bacterium]